MRFYEWTKRLGQLHGRRPEEDAQDLCAEEKGAREQ